MSTLSLVYRLFGVDNDNSSLLELKLNVPFKLSHQIENLFPKIVITTNSAHSCMTSGLVSSILTRTTNLLLTSSDIFPVNLEALIYNCVSLNQTSKELADTIISMRITRCCQQDKTGAPKEVIESLAWFQHIMGLHMEHII